MCRFPVWFFATVLVAHFLSAAVVHNVAALDTWLQFCPRKAL